MTATLVGMGYVDCQRLSQVLPDGRVLFSDVSFRDPGVLVVAR